MWYGHLACLHSIRYRPSSSFRFCLLECMRLSMNMQLMDPMSRLFPGDIRSVSQCQGAWLSAAVIHERIDEDDDGERPVGTYLTRKQMRGPRTTE